MFCLGEFFCHSNLICAGLSWAVTIGGNVRDVLIENKNTSCGLVVRALVYA